MTRDDDTRPDDSEDSKPKTWYQPTIAERLAPKVTPGQPLMRQQWETGDLGIYRPRIMRKRVLSPKALRAAGEAAKAKKAERSTLPPPNVT